MKDNTMSAKDLRLAITSMRRQAQTLFNRGKDYEALLREILNYDYYSDDDQPFPTGKELYKQLGINSAIYKKQLQQIYNELQEEAWVSPKLFTFSEVEYIFYAKWFEKSVSFTGSLPVRPIVGETFEFPFFKPSLNGIGFFYVSKISHELTDTKQRIYVWLEVGTYSFYENFKKEKDEYEAKARQENWERLNR